MKRSVGVSAAPGPPAAAASPAQRLQSPCFQRRMLTPSPRGWLEKGHMLKYRSSCREASGPSGRAGVGWGGGPILHLSRRGWVDPSRAAYGQAGTDVGVPGGPSPVEMRVLLQSGLWVWGKCPCTPPGGFPPSPPRTRSQSRSDLAYIRVDSGRNGTHPRRHACGQRRAMWFLAAIYFKAVFCFSLLDHSFCSRFPFHCFKYPPALFVTHFLTFFLFFFFSCGFYFIFFL